MLVQQNPNSAFPNFVFGDFMHFLYSPGKMLVRGVFSGFYALSDFTPFLGSPPKDIKLGLYFSTCGI